MKFSIPKGSVVVEKLGFFEYEKLPASSSNFSTVGDQLENFSLEFWCTS